MSLIPQSPPKQQPSMRTKFVAEWDHFAAIPLSRFALLLLPSTVLLYIDPLVPMVAYLLQIWAGSTGMWRDRWASLLTGAKECGVLLAALLLYTLLDHAQIWLVPTMTLGLQFLWHAHLPGDLSLSPLDGRDLLARTVLLLPLAPLLAVYYERVDPRTGNPLHRILTPDDLKPKIKRKTPPPPPTPAPAPLESTPAASQNRASMTKKAHQPPPAKHQMTIESFLASDPKAEKGLAAPPTLRTKEPEPINWDDITE